MTSDTDLLTFKAISNFVTELNELFGKKQHSLMLYARLINKTTIMHEQPILKHIGGFKSFCVSNRDAILKREHKQFVKNDITYSEGKVFIDMKQIFSLADKETQEAIWNHILTISAFVDPAGKAKEILRENSRKDTNNEVNDHETAFISKIIDRVEQTVGDENTDPTAAISSIMSSGVLTELIGGMQTGLQDGSLDISRLMGAVQGMVSTMSARGGNDPNMEQGMSMITVMMSNLSNGSESPENMLSGLMSSMGSMSSNSVEHPRIAHKTLDDVE
jgi:hypothetical protein